MKRSEYPGALHALGLTPWQVERFRGIIEDLLCTVHRLEGAARSALRTEKESYYAGKADGLAAVDRFLRGDLDAHDEFDD